MVSLFVRSPVVFGIVATMLLGSAPAQAERDFAEIKRAFDSAPGIDRNVRRCAFSAFITDRDPDGTNLRAAPRRDARVLARVKASRVADGQRFSAQLEVIGYRDGLFLIRDVDMIIFDEEPERLFSGTAWISAALVSSVFEHPGLFAEPRLNSRAVLPGFELRPDGSLLWSLSDLVPKRLHGCTGSMVEASYDVPGRGIVRGWTFGACSSQITTCGGGHRLVIEKNGTLTYKDAE